MAQFVLIVSPVEARQYAGGPVSASEFMYWLGEGTAISMTDATNGELSYRGNTINPTDWVVKSDLAVSVFSDSDFIAKYQAV